MPGSTSGGRNHGGHRNEQNFYDRSGRVIGNGYGLGAEFQHIRPEYGQFSGSVSYIIHPKHEFEFHEYRRTDLEREQHIALQPVFVFNGY